MNVFEKIYEENVWGSGSGGGSSPLVTKSYRRFIQNFLSKYHIKSVLDYGCGDWQFSQLINWNGIRYTGVDVAKKVIESNSQRFASTNVMFRVVEGSPTELPEADLLIAKDVLQHLSRNDIEAFLVNIMPRYKYALITNCVLPESNVNRDISTGDFRPLDLRRPPFNVNAKDFFNFNSPKKFLWRKFKFYSSWTKMVLLVEK